jgi:Zn-dependent protease with chaperone function
MNQLAALQLIALAGVSFALLLGVAASGCASWFVSATAGWAPERRHRALLLISLAPLVVAAFALFSALFPSLLALVWPEFDHCALHDDVHVHLCLVHLPRHAGNAASWLVLLVVLGWTSWRFARMATQLYRASRCAARLRAQGPVDPELGATVLPTPIPICLVAGLTRPTLLVSQGLLAGMDAGQVAVLLHHERAHAARLDILSRLIARLGTAFMWPSSRARLLGALELAAEQSCDEAAGSRVGDRLQVAATILQVERLLQATGPRLAPLAAAFGGDTVPERVSALLEARKHSGNLAGLVAAFAFTLCVILAANGPLHHLTESLLGALTH